LIIRTRLLALGAGLAVACAARAQDAAVTPAASNFLHNGPAHALAGCDLWRHRCKEVRLRVLDSDDGEANDVPRHSETLSGPGLSLGVTFELPLTGEAGQPNPLIATLKVTAPRWPLLAGLRLGDRRATVSATLGEPSVRIDSCWRYDDAPDAVFLCFAQDRLKSVAWEFFID